MKLGVLGAGSMGHGIAQVNAMAGHVVVLRDIDSELVDEGLEAIEQNLQRGVEREKVAPDTMESALENIRGTTSLSEACEGADLVIEAVPEDIELKKDVFSSVEEHAHSETVIATNTSSLSVTETASVLEAPKRALGLHFFNPVHLMPLVEIIVAEQTATEIREFAKKYVDGIDKNPATVRDFPGFSSSRLSAAFIVEAIRMVQEGVAGPEDIDTVMELGFNHPMGPLELADHTGLDINLDVLEYLTDGLGERFRPPQLLKQKTRAGKLGRKTGEGFYVWEDDEIVGVSEANH